MSRPDPFLTFFSRKYLTLNFERFFVLGWQSTPAYAGPQSRYLSFPGSQTGVCRLTGESSFSIFLYTKAYISRRDLIDGILITNMSQAKTQSLSPLTTKVNGRPDPFYFRPLFSGKKWLGWLKGVFKKNKMNVLEATPEKHDKMMAIVQALNHFNTITLGMALAQTNITLAEINKFSTPILRTKLDIIRKVFTESPEMYIDIIMGNPETEIVLDLYQNTMINIHRKIKVGGRAKSKEAVFKTARKLFGKGQ